MARSSKKGPYIDENLINKIKLAQKEDHISQRSGKKPIKTWARNSEISPEMVGFAIGVYNGKEHITVKVSEEMVGHKLGEFAKTRKFIKHGGRMAKEQEMTSRTTLPPGRETPAPKAEGPTETKTE